MSTQAEYTLGHSQTELQRLEKQGLFWAPATRDFLTRAGLREGMTVLDIGSGVGDVSLLAAELVGPRGSVLGIERSEEALSMARARASQAGLTQCRFEAADIDTFDTTVRFDAVIGRLILVHLPDPVASIGRLSRLAKPGGVMAFQEYYLSAAAGFPEAPLLSRLMQAMLDTLRKVGAHVDMGPMLYGAFTAAGLPDAQVTGAIEIVSRANPEGCSLLVGVIRALLPLFERLGVMSRSEADIETLEQRLRDEVSNGRVYVMPPLIGAWVRVPAHGPLATTP